MSYLTMALFCVISEIHRSTGPDVKIAYFPYPSSISISCHHQWQ